MIFTIKNENRNSERVKWLVAQVSELGGIDYAEKKMLEYRENAVNLLNHFEDSEVKNALLELVSFTTDRKY
jgi:octaprenyl-diphosphate synthase